MEEKKPEQTSDIKKNYESKDSSETKSNKGLIIGIAILILLLLGGGIYWLLQKDTNSKTTLVSLVDNKQEENKLLEWTSYVSNDGYFKIDYPDNWKVLDDEKLYFGVAAYDNEQEPGATVRIEKIEATNKIELQDFFDKKYEDCMAIEDNDIGCPAAIEVDSLEKTKISGEISRIIDENFFFLKKSIYVYMKDYYLAIYYSDYKNDEFLSIFERIKDSIYIDIESKYKHYYCNREANKILYHNSLPSYCHTVEAGDTLWSIAERYYGDPYLWEGISLYEGYAWDLTPPDPEDPIALSPGTALRVWYAFSFSDNAKVAGGTSGGWGLDTDTGDIYTTGSGKIYINNEIYDQGFGRIYRFLVDERTNNKIYIISPKKEEGESRNNFWLYQFIFNKQRNPYIGPGGDFELITFNHNEDKYAARVNARHAVPDPGFMALSNIGNGPEFDYLDSLIWYDNDTLIYRAQNDDQWRLVINHEDYKIYDYIENLRVEEGIIKFDARDKDGKWIQEEIFIEYDAYNAKLVSIPDEIPVGEEFFTYLKNTRSDLSEADLFKIEKNYHYKKGTLVDEFGNLVEDSVELYLDPVSDMGMSEDIGQLTFIAENGSFELFVYEIGPYTLSLPEGWSAQELEEINPVDFRHSGSDYKMTVSNEEYDKKAKVKYIQIVEAEDTLWLMAERYYGQGYYWPLVAENNDFDSEGGMPEINKSDEIYIFPFEDFHRDQLYELRKKYHEENIEEIFTVSNDDFSYVINYPACWELRVPENREYNENAKSYNSYIHRQTIIGPEAPKNPRGTRRAAIYVGVYDNRVGMDFGEFAVYRDIIDQRNFDEGRLVSETRDDGGILVAHYGEVKHLIFFKDDLIYDVTSANHHSIDDVSKQEMADMINSFKFID